MTTDAAQSKARLTQTKWYDGSLDLWQPRDGFRATTDAVLVAAAVDGSSRRVAELGGGGGAASLALARRCPEVKITAIERDPLMASLLSRNITENAMQDRLDAVPADIHDVAGPLAGQYDYVFFNPPYNDEASSLSGDSRRRDAMAGDDLHGWIRVAAQLLVDRGGMTMISRADRLEMILQGCADARLGEIVIRAVHGRGDQPAIRLLLAARKSVQGPMVILPPLVLRDDTNALTAEMEEISHRRGEIVMRAPGRKRRPPVLPQPRR